MEEEGFRLLLHPVFIHFPIAFYFLESFLLLLWIWKKDETYHRFALLAFQLGYGGMLVAMVTGYFDAGGWEELLGAVRNHFFSALVVFTFYTARAFYWKRGSTGSKGYPWIMLSGAFLGNLVVIVTGFFGGKLVYG